MKTLNPILILAAAADRSGNSYFARQLLAADRGHRDCKSIRKSITRLAGQSDLNIAYLTERSMLLTGSPDLKRRHIDYQQC